jgi:undecaprenyl-diphosphatase
MEWWQAVVLGLVEGITEYLPVSSTGHLILASWLLGLDDPARKEAVDAFNIVIQGGAILAVLGLYARRVQSMLQGAVGYDAAGRRLLINVALAFLPAAVLGPMLDDLIESYLFSAPPVLFALAVGGAWMIWLDRRPRTENPLLLDEITPSQAIVIGCLQCVAMWPGTSRSMMTIAGGTLVGLRPQQAAEFSFLVGLPTLGAACVYKLLKNLLHAQETGGQNLFQLLGIGSVVLGITVATISAAFAVRGLVAFLGRYGLAPFGWYRIALTAVLLGLVLVFGMRIGA